MYLFFCTTNGRWGNLEAILKMEWAKDVDFVGR